MMLKKMLVMVSIMVLGLANGATALTVEFQDTGSNVFVTDYDGTEDNNQYSEGRFNDLNAGTALSWQVKTGDGGITQHAIQSTLKFGGLDVMAGQYDSIVSASISITASSNPSDPPRPTFTLEALRISDGNADWLQATSTWNERIVPGTAWVGGGGLMGVGGTSGSEGDWLIDPATPRYSALTFSIPTDLVEEWITGVNAGLLLRPKDGEAMSYMAFKSSEFEHPAANYRPKLTIEYIPEPATMLLLGLGGLLIRRKR